MLGSCIRRLSVVGLALKALIGAPAALAAIGSTPGVASVTSSGTAQYSIPLWTPPGTGGIRPQLSLVYGHQQPNGILGVGWSIGGLSSIRRCSRTLAQDGVAAPVNVYDPGHQDRFCLDGNRLRWVSGNPYGVAPSTYRTELETFARITANDSLGTGPAWFRVEGKDGLFYEYGNSPDSRQIPTGYTEAETWSLSKIADRNGNYLTITYDLENGSLRPDEIIYTGTAALGPGSYVVRFVYEPAVRTDQIQGYEGTSSASGLVREVRRLLRIEMRHSGSVVRQYLFTYESGTGGISRLKTVTECATTPSDCLSPTNLDWHSGVSGFAATTISGSTYPQSAANVYTVDLNADGREDILWYNGTAWRYALGQSNGQLGAVLNGPTVARQWSLPIEWDGDGRTDLLYAASNQFYALRSNGAGFDAAVATGVTYSTSFDYWTADLDGDGLDDLVKLSTLAPPNANAGKIWARLRRGSGLGAEALAYSNAETWFWGGFRTKDGYMTTHVRRPDFNGDARMDLLIQGCFGYDVEFGTCVLENGWFPFHSYVPATASAVSLGHINVGGFLINSAGATNLRPLLGDFNADGKTDLAYPGAQYWYMYESRGGGQTVIQGPSISGFTQSSARVADYDGDGYSDLFAYKTPGGLQVMRSNGKELETPISAGLTGNSPILVADIAGDGLADLYAGTGNGYAAWNHNVGAAGSFPNLLKRATDGFGVFADFAYRPMTDSSVYTKYSGAAFPVIDEANSRQVVSQLTLTDGSGTTATYANTYTYEGARRHLQGRGFLGFAKRIVTDGSAGYNQRTEESYQQDFPYTGLLDSVILKQSSGAKIREIINSWWALSDGSGYDTRFYPYVYSATKKLYELSGTHFATITTTLPGTKGASGIDTVSGLVFDFTTTTTEVATGVNPASSKSERIYHSAIFNDTPNWCLGRPDYSRSVKSHTLGGGGQKTRTVDPSWDAVKCRLTQQIIEPGDPDWSVTTALDYDDFGNVDNQTVTGAAMSPRTTTINWGTAGQFPESITQSVSATFSQTITQGFRYDLGLQTSLTDPNHLVTNELITSWEYDGFGRRTKETRPDGTDTVWSIVTCGACESRVKYVLEQVQRTDQDVPIRTDRLYLDRFDRAVHAYSQLPGGGYSDRVVQFDARGRLIRQDVPYWGPAQPTGTTGDNGSLRFTYDQLDRATAEQLYTGVGALDRQTTHAVNGLSVTTTDPETNQTTRYVTAWGDLTRVTDAAGGSTNYQYEAFGLLSQVTDAYSHVVSTIGYNVRGMKTGMTDMDMGSWTFVPNALGEVEKVRDAKTIAPSWTTQTTFDHLGRATKRIEAEGTTDFYFGTSAQAHNIGRLESVIGPGYSEILTYDAKTRLATRSITTDTTYQIVSCVPPDARLDDEVTT